MSLFSKSFMFSSLEKSTDRDLVNSILDVEDLVKFGNKQRWDLCIHFHLLVCYISRFLFCFILSLVRELLFAKQLSVECRATGNDYFHYCLMRRLCSQPVVRKYFKCNSSSQSQFPKANDNDIIKSLVLSNQHPKTQRYSVYHIR